MAQVVRQFHGPTLLCEVDTGSVLRMSVCFYCHAENDADHYRRIVENHTPLHGPWAGWRMAGRYLVAPDRTRITPERLRGLMFREAAELRIAARRDKKRTLCPVVALPARERFEGSA